MAMAYVRESPAPKTAENKVQETLHFRYLEFLVISGDLFSLRPIFLVAMTFGQLFLVELSSGL